MSIMIIGKRASEVDFESYFILKSDQENIKWTGHSNAPERQAIYGWYIKNISRKDRYFFLFLLEGTQHCIGYLYMDYIDQKRTILEISLGVHSGYAGKGYGTEIIKFATDKATSEFSKTEYLEAWVAEENIGSIKTFLRNNYQKTELCKEVAFGDGTMKRFYKYTLKLS